MKKQVMKRCAHSLGNVARVIDRSRSALLIACSTLAIALVSPNAAGAVDLSGYTAVNPNDLVITGSSNNILGGSTIDLNAAVKGTYDPAGTIQTAIYLLQSGAMNVHDGVTINAMIRPGGNTGSLLYTQAAALFRARSGTSLTFSGTAGSPIAITYDAVTLGTSQSAYLIRMESGSTFSATGLNVDMKAGGGSYILALENSSGVTKGELNDSRLVFSGYNGGNVAAAGSGSTMTIRNSEIINNSTTSMFTFSALKANNLATMKVYDSTIGSTGADNPVIRLFDRAQFTGENLRVFSHGYGSYGVWALSGATAILTDSTIFTQAAEGLYIDGVQGALRSSGKMYGGSIVVGALLGNDPSDSATFGLPVDSAGNLAGGIDDFVNAPGKGVRSNAAWVINGAELVIGRNALGEGTSISVLKDVLHAFAVGAEGAGSTADLTGTIISTKNVGGVGVYVVDSAVATLEDIWIETSGVQRNSAAPGTPTIEYGGAYGLNAGRNGTIVMNGGAIFTEGQYGAAVAAGAAVSNWGDVTRDDPTGTVTTKITLNGAGIWTFGAQAAGVVSALGATVELNQSTVSTAGASSPGLRSERLGNIAFHGDATGTAIMTAGNSSHGIEAVSSGRLTLDNILVGTAGQNSDGLYADDSVNGSFGGAGLTRIDVVNGVVSTSGDAGHGVYATHGGIINIDDVAITTSGTGAHGLNVDHFGVLNVNQNGALNRFAVTVNGNGAAGAHAGIDGALVLSDGDIVATGVDGSGLMISDNGVITFNNGTVSATGAGAAAIWIAQGATGSVTVDPSILTSTNGPAIVGDGSAAGSLVALKDVTVIGNGVWLDVHANGGAGNLTVTADASHMTGAALTDAASTSALTMTQGTLWDMTGSSNVTTLINDGSVVDYATPAGDPALASSYRILTANNYIGVGGTLRMNTWLGSDGSPSDHLVIDGGTATGTTGLLIRNSGGPGDYTDQNGIMVVQALNGATTDSTAFHLVDRVASGSSEYLLYYGGNAASGGDTNDQNWYLRNTRPDDPSTLNVRVEVPLAMVIPPLALEYGYSMLDTLHERVGETWIAPVSPGYEERIVRCKDARASFRCVVRVPVATANDADRTKWASSGWARLMGERGFRDNDNFFRRGADYNYTFSGLQAGLDIYAREKADGTLDRAGIYVGIGQISSDVKGAFGGKAGTVDMDAYTVGAYWTHFAASGWYTDAVVQGTWYDAEARSVLGQQIKPNGFGIIASLEGGYAFKLGGNWTLEPQAQLAYQNVNFDNARDRFGFVSFDDGESLRGRLGLRLTKTWNAGEELKPRLITGWMRANLWHEFLGSTKTSFGSVDGQNMVPFTSSLGGTWAEIGAGVSGQVSESTSLFATAAYNRSLDNKGRESWDGRLGLTVKW